MTALASVFARYANTTFGGGSATIAVLRDQVVVRRAWVSESEFELAYGLSRLTPGTNLLAFCTAVGWMSRRWAGAVTTLMASSLPCAIIAVVATHFYDTLQGNHYFHAAMRGALAGAVAVMLNTAWVLARSYALTARKKAAVVFAGAFVAVRVAHVASFHVLLLAALVGLAWPSQRSAP